MADQRPPIVLPALPDLGFWQGLVYAASLAFWKAFFEMLQQHNVTVEEVPDATDRDATRRLRVLVQRLSPVGPARPDGGPPAGG